MSLTEPRLLVQISDTHILPEGCWLDDLVDTAQALREAVRRVQMLRPRPLGVLITGDLVEGGSAAAYRHLRRLLAPLDMPVWLLPGNHDDRALLRSAFPDHDWLQARASGAFIQYTVDLPGLRLVTLDTVVANASHGSLCNDRLDWLDHTLGQAQDVATMIAMHHPPFATHIGHMDAMGLREGANRLADIVARHRQVERIVCGHIHRSVQRRLAGTVVMTVPSTAHQIALQFGTTTGCFTLEPPALALHVWHSGPDIVSHHLPVGHFPGPFRFA
ncbi:MAG: phosphodiesterase [Burkholderiaceae bacterium]